MGRPRQTEFLREVLGDESAVALCSQLFAVSQVFDDLHDGDQAVTRATLHQALWQAFVEIPSNPFYRRHFEALQPVIRVALTDWLDSTALEDGDDHEQRLAFVLRDTLTAMVSQCAYLTGGYDWLIRVSPQIRRWFHDETWANYQHGLNTMPVASQS